MECQTMNSWIKVTYKSLFHRNSYSKINDVVSDLDLSKQLLELLTSKRAEKNLFFSARLLTSKRAEKNKFFSARLEVKSSINCLDRSK